MGILPILSGSGYGFSRGPVLVLQVAPKTISFSFLEIHISKKGNVQCFLCPVRIYSMMIILGCQCNKTETIENKLVTGTIFNHCHLSLNSLSSPFTTPMSFFKQWKEKFSVGPQNNRDDRSTRALSKTNEPQLPVRSSLEHESFYWNPTLGGQSWHIGYSESVRESLWERPNKSELELSCFWRRYLGIDRLGMPWVIMKRVFDFSFKESLGGHCPNFWRHLYAR